MTLPDEIASAKRNTLEIPMRLSLRDLGLIMAGATLFFTAAGAAVAVARFAYGHDYILGMYALFNLGSDANVPAWYASLALLICSALLVLHAIASQHYRDGRTLHWWLLAAIFLLLSIDEVARLHETLGGLIGRRLVANFGNARGLFYYSWVIPGSVFASFVALMFIRFLLRLPPLVRYGMLTAGALFVGGALGVEMFNSQHASLHGTRNLRYQLGTVFEEFLEMAGIALFAHVLVRHLGDRAATVGVQIVLRKTRPQRSSPRKAKGA
jgi:hypothetical protein